MRHQRSRGLQPKLTTSRVYTNALRAARIALGWSLDDLSAASGVSRSAIGYAEQGRAVHAATALKLAEALGKKVEDLWGLRDEAMEQERARMLHLNGA